jgi:prolyl oligopeptidase
MKTTATLALAMLARPPLLSAQEPNEDPLLWLEDVLGERALAWVKDQNARSTPELEGRPEFKPIYERTLEILDSKDKIPLPSLLGTTVYNFWKDERHERGIWRRTSVPSYRTPAPAWETVIDVDALAAVEKTPWVFKGAQCLPPAYRRCLVSLSRGGADAAVVREFDTETRTFVEGGFSLPEAKSVVSWRDQDSIWVGTDFGAGSLTTSGYPRVAKLWQRGTPLAEARVVFEGKDTDVAVTAVSQHTPEGRYDFVQRIPAFFRQESFLVLGDRLVRLDVPEDADFNFVFKDKALFSLRSDWNVRGQNLRAGSLVAIDLDDLLRGSGRFETLFEPSDHEFLAAVSSTRERVVVATLDNVRSRLRFLTLSGTTWARGDVALPGSGATAVVAASDEADVYFFAYEDFLTPSSLWLVEAGSQPARVKSMPVFFDAAGMAVSQHHATSRDGTKIPYFVVTPRGFKADGRAAALLNGYGGFEVAKLPAYSGTVGSAWLARGGVYVLANLRGGGEFGPKWHEVALKENRIKVFEDFIAVADDLVARKVTSPKHLGAIGGSQGGLLVAGAFTMRPELFGAIVSQVPLADMRRYSKLLAGASWVAEYGDPDVPEQWAYIKTWSPYHLLKKDARYPTPFFWTNTRDDRVHPGHARKMVARMRELGYPVYYFENIEGGHGSGSVNKQTAYVYALQYAYLWKMLGTKAR